ncbi:MAG: hypothetical protein LUC24_05365 [Bacteroidales bacterium]|nr:hypothetical protein [Bacteroidales bacterium]
MIIANGTLEWRVNAATAAGLDPETGFPVKTEEEWGDPVPCQIVPEAVDRTAKGSAGGERRTALSLTVLLEEGAAVEASVLRLKDRSGRVLGVFPVKAYEPLEAVRQMKVTV